MKFTQQPAQNLYRLLAAEDRKKQDIARNASSRHSRFGTTIAVRLKPNKKVPVDRNGDNAESSAAADAPERGLSSRQLVLHRQAAITQESGSILDITKHQRARKANKVDELAREDSLSFEARLVLQGFAREFVESCFNCVPGDFLFRRDSHTVLLSRSISFLIVEGYQVGTTQDHGEGPSSSVVHHQVATRVLPQPTIQGEHRRWPAEVESRACRGGH